MTPGNLIRHLAARADREDFSGLDVAPAVLRRLRSMPPRTADRPLLVLALGTAFSAVLVSWLALPVWENWNDPLTQIILQISAVLP